MPRSRILPAAIISLLLLTGCQNENSQATTKQNSQTQEITLNKETYQVELATTSEQIQTGLMYRTELTDDQGMLFLFDSKEPRSFWMKNTLVPLDIIFLDENNQIINIHKQVPPCQEVDSTQTNCPTYNSEKPSQTVLELKAGQSDKHNFQPKDQLIIH